MIITSRDGLFSVQNGNSILLKKIQCFGICNFPNNIYYIFHFLGEKNKDTKQGKISRFVIKISPIIIHKTFMNGKITLERNLIAII